ncbi:MAG: hypothetical protein ACI3XM_10910 [Eubacteriales bacterium]
MKNKLNQLILSMYLKYMEIKNDEDGMEIIQVLVLLALGLALIVAFMVFRDSIMGRVQELIDDFLSKF